MTMTEKSEFEWLEKRREENKMMDFSIDCVAKEARPKKTTFKPNSVREFSEPVSDFSSEEEDSEDSEEDEYHFSNILDSALKGGKSKAAERRRLHAEKEERHKARDRKIAEREARKEKMREKEKKKVAKLKRKKEKELKKLQQKKQEEMLREDSDDEKMHEFDKPDEREMELHEADELQQLVDAEVANAEAKGGDGEGAADDGKDAAGDGDAEDAEDAEEAEFAKFGEEEDERCSSAGAWEPPEVCVGDELILMQYPHVTDCNHPHSLNVKVCKINNFGEIFYRVDPQLDTDKFVSGAALLKLYKHENLYRCVGLHCDRCNAIDGKPISWCHRGVLFSNVLERMREDLIASHQKSKEQSKVEEVVVSANYRKMSMMNAKRDIMKIQASNSVSDIGVVNAERGEELLLNAEASGIHTILLLMQSYKSEIEIQTVAFRVVVRMLLGTHVQSGLYKTQREAIELFGEIGVLSHVVEVMRAFPDSTKMTVSALWLLALLTQSVENARKAGREGANVAVAIALKHFAVFGKGNAPGQKWGAACVVNLAKVQTNREELVKEGVLKAVVKLLDNSTSVKNDYKCILSVIGAIQEMGRKPHFQDRRTLVDQKIMIVIKETKVRFQDFSDKRGSDGASDSLAEDSESDEEKKEEKRLASQKKKEEDELQAMKDKIKRGLSGPAGGGGSDPDDPEGGAARRRRAPTARR